MYAGKYTVDAMGMNMRHMFHHKAHLLGTNIDHYEDDVPFPKVGFVSSVEGFNR